MSSCSLDKKAAKHLFMFLIPERIASTGRSVRAMYTVRRTVSSPESVYRSICESFFQNDTECRKSEFLGRNSASVLSR